MKEWKGRYLPPHMIGIIAEFIVERHMRYLKSSRRLLLSPHYFFINMQNICGGSEHSTVGMVVFALHTPAPI